MPYQKTCPEFPAGERGVVLPKDTLGAIELTQQAIKLLKQGKTELAKAKFAEARKLDANVVFGDDGI